jgi:hypothetical protein
LAQYPGGILPGFATAVDHPGKDVMTTTAKPTMPIDIETLKTDAFFFILSSRGLCD